jgi:hypothetical protein
MADTETAQQQQFEQPQFDNASDAGAQGKDERSEEEIKKDNELAERLSSIIEEANNKVVPLCKMIRKVRDLLSRGRRAADHWFDTLAHRS